MIYNWKGNKVGNKGLHQWVRKHINKPKGCKLCKNKDKPLQLANRTGIYSRNFDNWFFLCSSCHIKYDRAWLKRKDDYFKKGYKKTPEHLIKISGSLKGRKVWNKGLKGTQEANSGTFKKGKEHSDFMRKLWRIRKSHP